MKGNHASVQKIATWVIKSTLLVRFLFNFKPFHLKTLKWNLTFKHDVMNENWKKSIKKKKIMLSIRIL